MTLTTTSPQSMRFANAILERSAVVLLKGFAVNQMKVVPASSVDVTSDKTAVRFALLFYKEVLVTFFVQAKKVTGLQDKNTL